MFKSSLTKNFFEEYVSTLQFSKNLMHSQKSIVYCESGEVRFVPSFIGGNKSSQNELFALSLVEGGRIEVIELDT